MKQELSSKVHSLGLWGRMIKSLLIRWFQIQMIGQYLPGVKTVVVANRSSSIDPLLLAIMLPEPVTIVLPQSFANTWQLKLLNLFADILLFDPNSAYSSRKLVQAIKSGRRCILFPEGVRQAREEQLKLYESIAFIIQKTAADVLPVRIDGGQFSLFSCAKDKHNIQLFPKISLHVQDAEQLLSNNAKPNRKELAIRLFRIVSDLNFENRFHNKLLFPSLVNGAKLGKKSAATIEDINRVPLSYKQFVARCFILGRQIKKQTQVDEHVGVMMPTTVAGMVTFFALHAYRRIPAMLNFSMGLTNILSACAVANIKTIYTSKQFVKTANLESLVESLADSGLRIHYLEDFKTSINLANKLAGVLKGLFPTLVYNRIGKPVNPKQTALILFTSGSEGDPKAVALSHFNVLANCYQMMARVDFNSSDQFFNALPIFHCFGLTAGSILPLVAGMHCFFYPSPLHYKIIPGLVAEKKATIMFGTDTFLTGYARAANKDDFSSVRYIFAGAEKVKHETSRYWKEELGVTIYEGYGATETSPVISLNCFLASVPGSVGMILSQMEYRILPVEGISEGGRLLLRGPNVMLGYLRSDNSGTINAPLDGWHDTGDIVTVNSNGILTIIGRAKRFAKIGGEMVSLTAVEGIAAAVWPEVLHAALIKKTQKKGEKIVLFTEAQDAEKSIFVKKVKELGHTEILVPYEIYPASSIPVLPSGKIDYRMLETNTNF